MNNNSFFGWIRRSHIVRGDQRWVGGVCSGIAYRLGWDVSLVRVLMILLILVGAGLLVYPIAWILLPNSSDTIIAEEMTRGHLEGEGIVALIILAIGACSTVLTFWGLATVALFFGLIQYSINQSQGFVSSASPYTGSPYTGAPYATGQPSGNPFSQAGAPAGSFAAGTQSGTQSAAQASTAQAQAQAQQQQTMPRVPRQPQQPLRTYPPAAMPLSYVERERFIRTRRSGGPVLRLLVWGGIFLSAAIAYAIGLAIHIEANDYLAWGRLWMLWGTGVTIAICVITLVLALMGRKTAGYAWLGAFGVIICLIVGGMASSAARYETYSVASGSNNPYFQVMSHRYTVSNGEKLTLSKNLVKQLEEGTYLTNSDKFHTAHVTLDLSNWEKVMGKHTWTKADGTQTESACPTGNFKINLNSVALTIKVPKECTVGAGIFSQGYAFENLGKSAWEVENTLNHQYAERFRDILRANKSKAESRGIDLDQAGFDFLDQTDDSDWETYWEEYQEEFDNSVQDLPAQYRSELEKKLHNDVELHISTTLPLGSIRVEEA